MPVVATTLYRMRENNEQYEKEQNEKIKDIIITYKNDTCEMIKKGVIIDLINDDNDNANLILKNCNDKDLLLIAKLLLEFMDKRKIINLNK